MIWNERNYDIHIQEDESIEKMNENHVIVKNMSSGRRRIMTVHHISKNYAGLAEKILQEYMTRNRSNIWYKIIRVFINIAIISICLYPITLILNR